MVIGQTNFTDNKANRNGETGGATLNDPFGLFLDEDPENEEDPGRIFIADRANSRVVIWEELPEPPKEGQEKEPDPESVVYEQDELMGEDDDFEDEDDMVPTKDLPVA
jgi:hypothetical protein